MESATPIPRPVIGRTFIVAIAVLGVVAAAQIIAVAWAFMTRYYADSLPVPTRITRALSPEPPEQKNLVLNDTFAPVEDTAAPGVEAALPKPTPVPQAAHDIPNTPAASRVTELVEQARTLRERGDTTTALTRLREAQTLAADSALIISEMAVTYEKMGLADKAAEQWRRIFNMGETAGIYYSAAEAKLKSHDAGPGLAQKDADGFQPGSQLSLLDISSADAADLPGKKAVRIPLRARKNAKIDVRDVVIQVYFYDLVDDQSVVQTNANVSSHWSTLPADWADDEIEVLEVDYSPQTADSRQNLRPDNRKFFGYVVRVYYKNELQDMRAEPVKLLRQFPPPLILQADERK